MRLNFILVIISIIYLISCLNFIDKISASSQPTTAFFPIYSWGNFGIYLNLWKHQAQMVRKEIEGDLGELPTQRKERKSNKEKDAHKNKQNEMEKFSQITRCIGVGESNQLLFFTHIFLVTISQSRRHEKNDHSVHI